MESEKASRYLLVLVMLWALLFSARLGEAQLKMDAMTYSSIAKHLLTQTDWRTFHFTRAEYSQFFQHPPLIIWMQGLVFKFLGVSPASARLLPALFGLATILGVFFWGTLAGSLWQGFAAAVILLTSTRYLKYGSDFILDGPLSAWLVWGSVCFLAFLSQRKKKWVLGYGLCLAGAFFTKGVVAFSLPLVAGFAALVSGRKAWLAWAAGLAIAFLLLAPWLWGYEGVAFLKAYWAQSVTGRVAGSAGLAGRFQATRSLLESYWPWLPLWLWGSYLTVRANFSLRFPATPLGFALLHGLVIFGAFSLSARFLEHYLVPFYPFAALLAAVPLSKLPPSPRFQVVRGLEGLAILAAFYLAISPWPLRTQRTDSVRIAARELPVRCHGDVREVLISQGLAERWLALASVEWETDWDATSVLLPVPPSLNSVLVTAVGESAPAGWQEVSCTQGPYRLFQPPGSGLCR